MATPTAPTTDRLDQMLALARLTLHGELPELERRLIAYFVEVLGVEVPCQAPMPYAEAIDAKPPVVVIPDDMAGPWEPEDAAAIVPDLVRAVERARAAR